MVLTRLHQRTKRASSVVPAGEYPAIMIESEKVATKANDGHYLEAHGR